MDENVFFSATPPLKLIALSQVEPPGWAHFTFDAQLVEPKRSLGGSRVNIFKVWQSFSFKRCIGTCLCGVAPKRNLLLQSPSAQTTEWRTSPEECPAGLWSLLQTSWRTRGAQGEQCCSRPAAPRRAPRLCRISSGSKKVATATGSETRVP